MTEEPDFGADWLTKEEAADRLRTTPRTISRWISERRIGTKKGKPIAGKKAVTLCDPVDIDRLQSEAAQGAILPPEFSQQKTATEVAVLSSIPQMVAQLSHAIAHARTGTARPYMDLNEAEGYSGLPRRLLLRLVMDHRLPALNFSKQFYVKKRDLDNIDMRP